MSRWQGLSAARGGRSPAPVSPRSGGTACIAWILLAKTNAAAFDSTNAGSIYPTCELTEVRSSGRYRPSAPFPCATIQRPPSSTRSGWCPSCSAGRRHQERLIAAPTRSAGPADPLGGDSHDVDRAVLHVAGPCLARPLRAAPGRRFPRTGRTCTEQGRSRPRGPLPTRGDSLRAGAHHLLRSGGIYRGRRDLSSGFAASGPAAIALIAALALAGGLLPLLLARREPVAPTPTGPVPSRAVAGV